jgi:hypothetical protein
MTRWIRRAVSLAPRLACATVCVLALSAGPALAGGGHHTPPPPPPPCPPEPALGGAAPEIKPGAAVGALALVLGASLIVADRRRRYAVPEPAQA